MLKLVVLSPGMTGRTYELKLDKTSIGRVEDNSFQVAEPSVSSHHCEVLLRGSEVVVRDLNSTNGTYISGERITERTLKPGQILRLGQSGVVSHSAFGGSVCPPRAGYALRVTGGFWRARDSATAEPPAPAVTGETVSETRRTCAGPHLRAGIQYSCSAPRLRARAAGKARWLRRRSCPRGPSPAG